MPSSPSSLLTSTTTSPSSTRRYSMVKLWLVLFTTSMVPWLNLKSFHFPGIFHGDSRICSSKISCFDCSCNWSSKNFKCKIYLWVILLSFVRQTFKFALINIQHSICKPTKPKLCRNKWPTFQCNVFLDYPKVIKLSCIVKPELTTSSE